MDASSPSARRDQHDTRTAAIRGDHAEHRTTSTMNDSTSTSTAGGEPADARTDTSVFDGALTEADLAFLAGAEIGAAVAGTRRASTTATLDDALRDETLHDAGTSAVDVVALDFVPPAPPLRYGHLVWSILVASLLWCLNYIHAFSVGCTPDVLGCASAPSNGLLDNPTIATVVACAIGAGVIGLAPWTPRRGLRAGVAVFLGILMLVGAFGALSIVS
ncbi:hypothetical protein [Schumannella sp. 10F1B-5-1]|uniref:hypothetical protein n=1 Tax=Schumannella sp. 10F1B-5-1 TaxID=2590780 RepID=UPI001132608E|nr:hypothetical protein [Schumannella sp. 10F1B-5-1]TPW78458.1 hypothetical protein FJ658_01255 [Schumannella sp. 10F1B-5-1]